tara:strand:- start:188 stop:826 length:639 start_codon:yes stop_codon:yes gene_type:complete
MSKITNVQSTYINWGPYVMKTKMPDYIVKKLKTEGKKTKENYNYKLAGHLDNQYKYPANVQKWFYEEIQPIVQAYRNGHCKFHGIEELTVELSADDLWVNYMKAGDFNPIHTHGGDYSFVLFLDIPKQLKKEQEEFEGTSAKPGSLMFEYTQQARPRYATSGTAIVPETGDFFMFPAMLQHWVCPFKSKVTRISVSGNLRIVNWDKLPKHYF